MADIYQTNKKGKDSKSRANWIPLNDKMMDQFDEFIINQKEIQTFLSEKRIKQSNNAITYRMLNHWEKLGLIDNERPEGKGWRKYSTCDIVWMEIIHQLRKFGFSNENILKVKNDLIKRSTNKTISGNQLLQYNIGRVLCFRLPVFALIFTDGTIEFASIQEANLAYDFGTISPHHIRIELNSLVQKLYKKDVSALNKAMHQLSHSESKVLYEIRTNGYKNINVELKGEEISSITTEYSFGKGTNIHDLLKENPDQDLEIKQRKGKVVYAKKKVKK